MRARGFLICTGIKDDEGKPVALDKAIRYGWIRPGEVPSGWKLPPGSVPIGSNQWTDGGRQNTVFALGFRTPISDFTLQKFQVGTGTRTPSVTDVALQSPVLFGNGAATKNLDTCEFPSPFTLRAVFTLGSTDCNGYLLTEFGLLSGNNTLMARVVRPGINKTAAFSPTLAHLLRF